ncbi:hypothetical protein MSG28_012405 [Choristoneura fumiferana]|uniref:Uncharacterized protein n=1 Tax=Choristoneura fumiferana TaxID=7141 RepID=A0ACC0KD87_CHOFU|nr:hypothetical protein MSG28_012405 [Choristoneura fumiferana]
MDAWILDEEGLVDADVIIIDAKDISLRMLTKMNISVTRKMAKYQEMPQQSPDFSPHDINSIKEWIAKEAHLPKDLVNCNKMTTCLMSLAGFC